MDQAGNSHAQWWFLPCSLPVPEGFGRSGWFVDSNQLPAPLSAELASCSRANVSILIENDDCVIG